MGKKCLISIMIIVLVMVSASGCSVYNADIPEFTTAGDRDTGFVPSSDSSDTQDVSSGSLGTSINEQQSEVSSMLEEYQAEGSQFSAELEDVMDSLGN